MLEEGREAKVNRLPEAYAVRRELLWHPIARSEGEP
jgi:hypothetical protein